MQGFDRGDGEPINYERFVSIYGSEIYLGDTRIRELTENVAKFPFQACLCFKGGVNGYGHVLEIIVGPDIVEPGNMVFVSVGVNYGIESFHTSPKHLVPEIGAGIYNNISLWCFNENGRPQAIILFIVRLANGAWATYKWHSLGGACA